MCIVCELINIGAGPEVIDIVKRLVASLCTTTDRLVDAVNNEDIQFTDELEEDLAVARGVLEVIIGEAENCENREIPNNVIEFKAKPV